MSASPATAVVESMLFRTNLHYTTVRVFQNREFWCTKNKPTICKTVQLTRQRSVSSTTQNPTSTTAVAPAALAAASQLYHPPSAIQYPDTSSTTITTSSSKIPIFYRAPMYFDRVAVTDVDGDFTYEDVFRR